MKKVRVIRTAATHMALKGEISRVLKIPMLKTIQRSSVPEHLRHLITKESVIRSELVNLKKRIIGDIEVGVEENEFIDNLLKTHIAEHSRSLEYNGKRYTFVTFPNRTVLVVYDAEKASLQEFKDSNEILKYLKEVKKEDVKLYKKLLKHFHKANSKEERASAALTASLLKAVARHELFGEDMHAVFRKEMGEYMNDSDIRDGLETIKIKTQRRARVITQVLELSSSTVAMIGETFARMISMAVRSLGTAIPLVGRISQAGAVGDSLITAGAFLRMRMMSSSNSALPYLLAR